jgi:heptosyltransferase I
MHVLIIKTSSLGDLIHTFPALTDAGKMLPGIRFDWVVEENYAEVPSWHPLVDQVIPVAIRRWRKNPLKSLFSQEWKKFRRQIREKKYAMVVDAQGLIKSAVLTRMARGLRVGLDKKSLTESLARFAYQKTITVDLKGHAVTRMREIFARALNYTIPNPDVVNYGISEEIKKSFSVKEISSNYLVFLHGTTWVTKKWPDEYWEELAKIAAKAGFKVFLPWGNKEEQERAKKIAKHGGAIEVLPRMNLTDIAGIIANAKGAIAVDTGLGHLSAALDVPTISLYGPTDPKWIGTEGQKAVHLLAKFECVLCGNEVCRYKKATKVKPACFANLTPGFVWEKLWGLIKC